VHPLPELNNHPGNVRYLKPYLPKPKTDVTPETALTTKEVPSMQQDVFLAKKVG
jgi:hypothetical protein